MGKTFHVPSYSLLSLWIKWSIDNSGKWKRSGGLHLRQEGLFWTFQADSSKPAQRCLCLHRKIPIFAAREAADVAGAVKINAHEPFPAGLGKSQPTAGVIIGSHSYS